MKLNFINEKTKVVFEVSDYDSKYEDVFKSSFYAKKEGKYIKEYNKDEIYEGNLERIKTNFLKYGKEIFNQMAYLKEAPWEEGLKEFIKKAKKQNIDWWLTGSCALSVRGITVNPHDIDIMLNSKDENKIIEIFGDSMIEPLCNSEDWVVKKFAVLFLKTRIDLAFDPLDSLDKPEPSDCGPYAQNHLEEITWNSEKIKVPPIELQLKINKRRGRTTRVGLIQKYIEQQNHP
ncbi:MAG: nucleotidyltransferase domain-containing protein [Petrotogales bacterium]